MTREEIKNKIFQYLKEKIILSRANPHQTQQLQLGGISALFPAQENETQVENKKTLSTAREIIQELENSGFIYEGSDFNPFCGSSSTFPWFSITEYGKDALLKDDWSPYDPDGYLKALKIKVPDIDEITLIYIGEAVSAYNYHHLLSATLAIGVASENLILMLIEAYADWIKEEQRRESFKKKINRRSISKKYEEFKTEFSKDVKSFSKDTQVNWETYLDGIFNFIRLNRNDAGHPTGLKFDAKIIYANLQIFSEYSKFIFNLRSQFLESNKKNES